MKLIWSAIPASTLLLAVAAVAHADCQAQGQSFPVGGVACQGGYEFVCGQNAAWRKTLKQCVVKPKSPQTPPSTSEDSAKQPTPPNPGTKTGHLSH